MDCLPDTENNFPSSENLHPFKNISDLIRNNKFPHLIYSRLNIIIGVRQASLINFEKIRKPENSNEPFSAKCKMCWTIFGPDSYLKSKTVTCCNFVRLVDDVLKKKVHLLQSLLLKTHTILIKLHQYRIKSF